jgi:small-conductance mechanosensitive channel
MAVDGGRLAITIVITLTIMVPIVAVSIRLSHKLFPQPQRSPEQAVVVRRFKRIILLYCAGLLALAGLLWWATGSLIAGIGITLGVMVVLQRILSGVVTHEKARLKQSNPGRQ